MSKIRKDALRIMLRALQKLVNVYNRKVGNPSEQISLVSGTGQITSSQTEKLLNTKSLCICVYDDNCVGVFSHGSIDSARRLFDLYKDLFSDKLGIHNCDYSYDDVRGWIEKGDTVFGFTATCNMTKVVSYEEVRLKLYNAGKIKSFDYGATTTSEILKVLKYAPKYLDITKNVDKRKQKV